MQWQDIAGSLIVGLILLGAGIFLAYVVQRKLVQQEVLAEIRGKFAAIDYLLLTADAGFQGLDRSWDARWRGTGILVITDHMLYFRLWRRDLDLTIPLERVQQVRCDHRPGGKISRLPHLQVIYQGADGVNRTASWSVKHPEDFAHIIQERLLRMDHEVVPTPR
jgi:hypothetical protein